MIQDSSNNKSQNEQQTGDESSLPVPASDESVDVSVYDFGPDPEDERAVSQWDSSDFSQPPKDLTRFSKDEDS